MTTMREMLKGVKSVGTQALGDINTNRYVTPNDFQKAAMQNLRMSSGAAITEKELESEIARLSQNAMMGAPATMPMQGNTEIDIARQAIEKTMSPEELNAAIDALMMQKQGTNDPEELEEIDEAIQSTIIQGQAPYNLSLIHI